MAWRAHQRRKDGSLYWENVSISPVFGADGSVNRYVAVQEDVTERKRAEQKLQAAADQLRAILEASPIAVAIPPVEDATFVFGNSRFAEMFSVAAEQVVGTDSTTVMIDEAERRQILTALQSVPRLRDLEVERQRADGTVFSYLLSVEGVEFEGRPAVLWWAYDITEQRRVREKLALLAHQDMLTGLANRRLFADRMDQALARARRSKSLGALLYFDLDGFKAVNDTLGHRFGDWLLGEVAGRLQACIRESDLISRMGGDEFTVIIENLASAESVNLVADKVLSALCRPFSQGGSRAEVGVSVGIAYFDGSEPDVDTVTARADRAMYRAKADGKGTSRIYDPALDGAVLEHARAAVATAT